MEVIDNLVLSIVIPCYNEEDVMPELYRRVTEIARQVAGEGRYELVLVNDGSRDTTLAKIMDYAERDPHVVGVNLSRNFGHQLALTAGLELARGERILVLDADLQDPPELLPKMMELMDQGADVVYGQRQKREGETWFKKRTAAFFYRLLRRLTDLEIPVDCGDFRLMSRRVKEGLIKMPEKQRFIRGMVAWLGYKQVALPYVRQKRFAGTTKYPLSKMISFALDAITSFSTAPVRLSGQFAMLFTLVSLLLMLYILYSSFFGHTVPGWA
ncbi:MAG: glycosyltransferase family 2 protein, partial [Acidobacteriota bacterium]